MLEGRTNRISECVVAISGDFPCDREQGHGVSWRACLAFDAMGQDVGTVRGVWCIRQLVRAQHEEPPQEAFFEIVTVD